MDYNELYHHGIKGQKWGVRRFQKKDGTRTAAGKKRDKKNANDREDLSSLSDQELRTRINRMNLEKRYNNLSNARTGQDGFDIADRAAKDGASAMKVASNSVKLAGKTNPYINLASQGFNAASATATTAKKVRDASKKRADLSKLSDSELREKVNRMDLEQQYSSLRKETVSKGRLNATQVLDIAGGVLSVGASATALALGIRALKNR